MAAKESGEEIRRRGQEIYEGRLRLLLETEENSGKLAQGSPEWKRQLWSLGKNSYGTALSLEATSREVIYEDDTPALLDGAD